MPSRKPKPRIANTPTPFRDPKAIAGSRPHLGQSGDKLERKSRDQPSIAGAFEGCCRLRGLNALLVAV
jgi:hypothetical protein